jgi:formylglycine-generating enzyme required for sulfatase activity
MVLVRDYCVDRYEVSAVDLRTGEPLSPYYPPEPRVLTFVFESWDSLRHKVGDEAARRMPLPPLSPLQRTLDYTPVAVSRAGDVPQAFLSYYSSKRLCERAGKRLCTDAEWETACKGESRTLFPYGEEYQKTPCNVARHFHPAAVLHGLSSSGHLDPRLNRLVLAGDAPLVRVGGASQACVSRWGSDGVHDMVGNLDEWIEDERGAFRGGFYARRVTNGCEAQIRSHDATYFDYSTGTRCCKDAQNSAE